MSQRTADVLVEVMSERAKQDAKWGQQRHPDGTTDDRASTKEAHEAKALCALEAKFAGGPSWRAILREEVLEAFAEVDAAALRAELIQVAAVAVAWVEDIDGRST